MGSIGDRRSATLLLHCELRVGLAADLTRFVQVPDLESVADSFGIAFHVMSMNADNKTEIEEAQLALLAENRVDLVVLAKCMQIVSERFVRACENRIIKIHHAFPPAFPGARPCHSARARGP